MSNLLVNIRFGEWHFQIDRDRLRPRISHNPYQADRRQLDPAWRWFEVYEFFGRRG